MTRFFALLLLVTLAGCGCAGNRCATGWTYTYTPTGMGAGQWVVAPVYGQ